MCLFLLSEYSGIAEVYGWCIFDFIRSYQTCQYTVNLKIKQCNSSSFAVLFSNGSERSSKFPYKLQTQFVRFYKKASYGFKIELNLWINLGRNEILKRILLIHEHIMLLLLLLSRFSRVRLCATPQTAAHQDPPSLGFSRQEHWSGLPFPSPMHESEK